MMPKRISAGLLISCCTFLLVACGKDDDDNNGNGGNNNQNPGNTTNTITISNMSFSPSSLKVKAGTTVTWVNEETMSHTATANDGSFNSGTLRQNNTFKHTFSSAGTFPYHCALHSGMNGTVVVE